METNRWKLVSMRDGFKDSLEEAKNKLTALLGDSKSTTDQREAQQNIVADLTDRLKRTEAEIEAFDKAAEAADKAKRDKAPVVPDNVSAEAKHTAAYAALIRATMNKQPISQEIRAALKDDSDTGGGNFLPKTVSSQIITEPTVTNPLRNHSTFTNIANLEIPKLEFSIGDDDFVKDGETAKELAAKGDVVAFDRNKVKIFSEVSETILRGADADLAAYVNRGLISGLASKEKKVAFAATPKSGEEHMSFYSAETAIKVLKSNTLLSAIRKGIADLEDEYLENAEVCMRRADYLELVESLANGNASLYTAPPESILGVPAFFCDMAVKPIIGDFHYSHYNYDLGMTYESDKDIKTGMNVFVLTAYLDHRIKLSSAFRIAEVESV